MPNQEEIIVAQDEVLDSALHYGNTIEHHAITWYWLKHLYNAAMGSDLVGWENIEIARWLGED